MFRANRSGRSYFKRVIRFGRTDLFFTEFNARRNGYGSREQRRFDRIKFLRENRIIIIKKEKIHTK